MADLRDWTLLGPPVAALSMEEDVGTSHDVTAIIETRVDPRDCLMSHSMYSRVGTCGAGVALSGLRWRADGATRKKRRAILT
jgi:hypothetical protein